MTDAAEGAHGAHRELAPGIKEALLRAWTVQHSNGSQGIYRLRKQLSLSQESREITRSWVDFSLQASDFFGGDPFESLITNSPLLKNEQIRSVAYNFRRLLSSWRPRSPL